MPRENLFFTRNSNRLIKKKLKIPLLSSPNVITVLYLVHKINRRKKLSRVLYIYIFIICIWLLYSNSWGFTCFLRCIIIIISESTFQSERERKKKRNKKQERKKKVDELEKLRGHQIFLFLFFVFFPGIGFVHFYIKPRIKSRRSTRVVH